MKANFFSNTKKKQEKNSTVIYSAALQDHFMKKFNSSLDYDFSQKKKPQLPKKREQSKKRTFTKLPSLDADTQIKKLQNQFKGCILPYQDQFLKKLKEAKSDEVKMKAYEKKLTWAQKLGIVEAPAMPLTNKQWEKIEEKSKARGDSQSMCSICLEDFKIQPQVILNCSHVFHLKCLASYEKHNKAKCCPICRHKDYERKVIDEAIRSFTLKSIIRVQRVFRGSRDRIKVYENLIESGYKASSARFNRRLIGFKMWKLSRKITDKVRQDQKNYNYMLQNIYQQNEKSKQSILEEMVSIQRKKMLDSHQIEKYLYQLGIKQTQKPSDNHLDWKQTLQTAVKRQEDQCSICLMKLWNKPVYLLSCTHLFHVNCIEGFERYAMPGNKNKCPCCRSTYSKKKVEEKKK